MSGYDAETEAGKVAVDPVLARRLDMHEKFAAVIIEAGESGATEEDALAALASCALSILSQAPQGSYAKFLQDLAVMWQSGRKKIAEAQASSAIAPR
jgi:hypothetical protein